MFQLLTQFKICFHGKTGHPSLPTLRCFSSLSALPDCQVRRWLACTQICRQQHTAQPFKAPRHSNQGQDGSNPRLVCNLDKAPGYTAETQLHRRAASSELQHRAAPTWCQRYLKLQLQGHLWCNPSISTVPGLTSCLESQLLSRGRLFNIHFAIQLWVIAL